MPLPWPLAILDFEAGSLDEGGDPIELGLAIGPARTNPALGWSTPICPTWAWFAPRHCSPRSARVHGLTPNDLVAGAAPTACTRSLDAILLPIVAEHCDELTSPGYCGSNASSRRPTSNRPSPCAPGKT